MPLREHLNLNKFQPRFYITLVYHLVALSRTLNLNLNLNFYDCCGEVC